MREESVSHYTASHTKRLPPPPSPHLEHGGRECLGVVHAGRGRGKDPVLVYVVYIRFAVRQTIPVDVLDMGRRRTTK